MDQLAGSQRAVTLGQVKAVMASELAAVILSWNYKCQTRVCLAFQKGAVLPR
jgi:hypothetical protein